MGIRINSAVVYGVRFTNKEIGLYEKFIHGKPENFLLMMWVEKALQSDVGRYKCHSAYNFVKFNEKHCPVKPLRPFWEGMSAGVLKGADILRLAEENLEKHERVSEAKSMDKFDLWEPTNDVDFKPGGVLALVKERNYAREVDYSLVDFFNMNMENKVIPIVGRYPWECGTTLVTKGEYYTHNGENMLPDLPKEVLHEVLYHTGSKESFIKKKKKIWDQYHGDVKPYPVFTGDGWHGSGFYFYQVDVLFQVVAELVPGIKYDVMRLEKLLCLYWS